MNRTALRNLLTRYIDNQCTLEERQLIESWYELIGEPTEIDLSEAQWQALEAKIWKQLQPAPAFNPDEEAVVRPLWPRLAVAVSSIAAVVAIAVGINWYVQPNESMPANSPLVTRLEQIQWQQYANATATPKIIDLPDGSRVTLEPQAQLAVQKTYSHNPQSRDVRLLGEATFDVKRDPSRPFLVYSGDIVTKVLGTRFSVRATAPDKPIEVVVQTGKVTVYRQNTVEASASTESNGVILTPNQKVTYFPDNQQFATSVTDNPQPIHTISPEKASTYLIFDETPLQEVLHRLEATYGTEIELDREALASCPFTGDLTQQPLYTKLDLLCGAINGSYEIRGTKILITGKGCL